MWARAIASHRFSTSFPVLSQYMSKGLYSVFTFLSYYTCSECARLDRDLGFKRLPQPARRMAPFATPWAVGDEPGQYGWLRWTLCAPAEPPGSEGRPPDRGSIPRDLVSSS